MAQNNCIILTGIKHSGKSTQGKLLAEKLNCPFVDLDDVITEITGRTPREIYKERGPSGFMILEEEAARKTVRDFSDKKIIIATGGGICDNQPALTILAPHGKFVFLEVPEKVSLERIMRKVVHHEDGTWENLPAYISAKEPKTEEEIQKIFHKFYEERTKLYQNFADVIIPLSTNSKQENTDLILSKI